MSINKAIIKGRLGGDPENANGTIKFSIATDEGYKDKSGNKVEKTAWHRIVAFGKLGEILEKYLKKGDEVLIIGRISYHEHEGKYYTSIIANEFDFVGGKKEPSNANDPIEKPPFQPAENLNQEEHDDLPF